MQPNENTAVKYPSKEERLATLSEIFNEAIFREDDLSGAISFDRTIEGEPDEELFTIYTPVGFHRRQQASVCYVNNQLVLLGLDAANYVDGLLRNENGDYDIDFFALETVKEKFILSPVVATAMSSELLFVHNLEQKAWEVVFGDVVIMMIATDPIGPIEKLHSMITADTRINGQPARIWIYSLTSDRELSGYLTASIIQMYLERYC